MHEALCAPVKPARVIGVALNTFGMEEDAARAAVERATSETGLPATDPVRYGVGSLIDAVDTFISERPPKGT
jgi:uncharacterized NAD-dependent epimerase/dehydratase family protein